MPNNLTYRIDKNDDWYYLQNDSGKWNIEFSSNNLSNKNLLLKVALAGATQKQMDQGNGVLININLNGKKIFSERFENDRAAYRSALKSGRYHLIIVLITYNQLKQNQVNTISFTTDGYLMYDAIQLGEECKSNE